MLSTLLSLHLLCGAGAAAGADPWHDARVLRERAIEAQGRGELAVAAPAFAGAYQAAPEPCSAPALALLFEAVEAHIAAAALLDGRALCGFEELVEQATTHQACAAHRVDLVVARRDLERARRRAGGDCLAAEPALRAPDGEMQLGVAAPEQARRRERPPAPSLHIDAPDSTAPARARGLRIAGGVLLAAGAGASMAMLAGLVRGGALEREAARMVDANAAGCDLAAGLSGTCSDLASKGARMNRLAIGAGVAAAVLAVTGAILVATGARAGARAKRAAIATQGAGLTVRF